MSIKNENYFDMTKEEKMNSLEVLYRDFYTLRQKRTMGNLKQTHLLKQVRRNIARIKTALNVK